MRSEASEPGVTRSMTPFRPRPFRPSSWLPGPHLQTLGGKLLRPSRMPVLERSRLETPDGDFIDLDVASLCSGDGRGSEREPGSEDRLPEAPVVLLLHGLEGSSRRGYVLLASETLLEHGLQPVAMNFRGCSGEPNRTARFYHSGETEDLHLVLEHLRGRFPGRAFGAVGFSLGGNMLLKYLGEQGERGESGLDAAVAVSVPFDLAAGADRLEEGPMGRLYTHYFLRMLRRKIREKDGLLEELLDMTEVLRAPTLRTFDDAATAPLHGFRDAADYYRRCSATGFLAHVRTPTLLLQSRDDPFLPESAIPLETIGSNRFLVPGIVDRGGHVGFVEGRPWSARFWAEEEAARFLAHHLA